MVFLASLLQQCHALLDTAHFRCCPRPPPPPPPPSSSSSFSSPSSSSFSSSSSRQHPTLLSASSSSSSSSRPPIGPRPRVCPSPTALTNCSQAAGVEPRPRPRPRSRPRSRFPVDLVMSAQAVDSFLQGRHERAMIRLCALLWILKLEEDRQLRGQGRALLCDDSALCSHHRLLLHRHQLQLQEEEEEGGEGVRNLQDMLQKQKEKEGEEVKEEEEGEGKEDQDQDQDGRPCCCQRSGPLGSPQPCCLLRRDYVGELSTVVVVID